MSDGAVMPPSIERSEHIDENIGAKRIVPYGMGTSALVRVPAPFIDVAYGDIAFSNADANGNYQTIEFKSNGTTVRTLTLAFDANNKVTGITRS
jgi:hypothetical protein